jgi:glutamyl-tRNA synthetase
VGSFVGHRRSTDGAIIGAMPDGRFAPSPTGDLHLGNLRTAVLAWLFARAGGSRFLVRMEDLDAAAVRPQFYARQLDDLAALGLDWDGPVVRQSDRHDRYRAAIGQLERAGLTYPCFCTRREILEAATAPHGPVPGGAYPGTCRALTAAERARRAADGRPAALRLRGAGQTVTVVDALHGSYAGVIDDVVLRRNDGTPAYNLAVVVDDVAQGVGQVVRADDLLPSTPRQVHIAACLGLAPPTYAHVPLAVAPDGTRLAKRHGAVTLNDRAQRGESPGHILGGLLATVGLWAPGRPASAADLRAVAAHFDPDELPRSPWIVDAEQPWKAGGDPVAGPCCT